jgi:NAD-dependent DNA ligase
MRLPVQMGSMDKIHDIDEYVRWIKARNLPPSAIIVITPKYDGNSLVSDDSKEPKRAWQRGDGTSGAMIAEHYSHFCGGGKQDEYFVIGEAIMDRKTFEENYSTEVLGDEDGYKTARDFVNGRFRSQDVDVEAMKRTHFLRFGLVRKDGGRLDKVQQLEICNIMNGYKIPYEVMKARDVSEDRLYWLYEEWGKDFKLDGLVLDVNDAELREQLGRDSNGTPVFAVAFKGAFEEVKETVGNKLVWHVNKSGFLKPVIHINPVILEGVEVKKALVDNARTVIAMGYHDGCKVEIKRSGTIIPRIIRVLDPGKDGLSYVPLECPVCGAKTDWDEDYKSEIACTNPDCEGRRLKRIRFFFKAMDIKNVGPKTVELLWANGFDTVEKVLNMTKEDFMRLEGYMESKTELVYNSIHAKLKPVALPKLQHASGYFRGLGADKLQLVAHFKSKPTLEDLVNVKGFAEKSAKAYLDGIEKFWEFAAKIPATIGEQKQEKVSDEYAGHVYVFSGFRDGKLQGEIEKRGGRVVSSWSSKVTHLVIQEKGSGSKKEKEALANGSTVYSRAELETIILGSNKSMEAGNFSLNI